MKKNLRYTSFILFVLFGQLGLTYGQNKSLDTLILTDNSLSEKYIESDSLLLNSDTLRIAPPRTHPRVYTDEKSVLLAGENMSMEETQSLTTRTLNTDYLVGATKGTANITSLGAGTYTIPLELPVGLNGMQPDVSINYNSQSPNGILGYAWNLSAYSMISRTGKTYYHDGTTAAPQLNSSDNLMLDGQRLMLFSGTNLSQGAKYRTEIETFSDITYKYINGSLCFEIQTKDGHIMQYGTTTYSRFEAQRGTIFCWLLQRTTDANGNYMTYSYEKNNTTGEIYIKSIEYAGNTQAGITPVNKIEFFYNTRQDVINSFLVGNQLSTAKILKSIKITTSNILFREYTFNYSYDGFYNKLTEVIESTGSANNQRYNSTIIDWGADRGMSSYDGYEKRMYPINSFDTEKRLYADFNNDAKMDFITYPKKDLDQYTTSDYATLYVPSTPTEQYFTTGIQISLGAKFYDMQTGDFNGDGLMDVLKINQDPNNSNNYIYTIFSFNGNAFIQSYSFHSTSKKCLIADFDGNGRADIYTGSALWRDGTSVASGGVSISDNIYLADFTGSRKINLLNLTSSGYAIYELSGNNFSTIQSGTSFTSFDTPIIADFNGDGKTDILVKKSSTQYFMLFATGIGFQQKTLPNLNITGKCFTGDFNRDGKADIIFADAKSRVGQTYPVRVGLFDGNNFQFTNYTTGVNPTTTVDCSYYPSTCNDEMNYIWESGRIVIIDLDGDGRSELLCDDNRPASNIKSFPDSQNLFVSSITDGLNRKTSFTFSTVATDEVNGYNLTASFEILNNQAQVKRGAMPLPVLAVLQTEAGNIINTTEFEYGRMVQHNQGKGFLCFEEITAYNFGENRRKVTKCSFSSQYYNSYVTAEKVFTLSGQPIITNSYIKLVNISGGGITTKVIFPYTYMQTATDHLSGLAATANFSVDSNGNTSYTSKTTGSLTTNSSTQYAQYGSWLPNKPVSVTVSNTLNGESQVRTISYEYDLKGNLSKETSDPGDLNTLTVSYKNFDTFGHPLTVETTANGQTRTATYQYTSSGRFLGKKTDALGETTTYGWTETKGTLLGKTDNSGYTQYYYDAMGRRTSISDPSTQNGRPTVTTSYNWENNGDKLYYIQEQTGTLDPVRTYYNAAGKEILQESYGLNAQKISLFTEYFPDGKVKRVSAPTFGSSPTEWDAAYTYDNIGRTLSINTLNGTTTYAYSGLTTSLSSPMETRQTTLNNFGKTATSTINGKSVSYQYYPSGLLKSTMPEGGESIALEYDLQGNRTKITDPDAGLIRSEYDGFGQLISTTQKVHLTGESISTINTYAANGLLQSINRNGEITTYTYDNKNRVSTIEIQGQHKQTFTYDNRSRITNVKEEIDGRTYNTSTTYDKYDRPVRNTFPSGYYAENNYGSNGLLTSVTDRYSKLIWQAEAENARGQMLQEKRGNTFTFHEFNNKGQLTRSNNTVFDWSYDYDSSHNLSYRSDNIQNLREDFDYDALNRLTSWDITQNGTFLQGNSISYDALTGRITDKSDAGYSNMLYGENNNKPHALTSTDVAGTAASDLTATYTDFKKLKTLAEGDKFYMLTYGVDQQRRKSVSTENDVPVETRYYIGSYEEKINELSGETEKIHYLSGGAVYIERTPLVGDPEGTLYFAYADHLGSLTTLTDYAGNVVERYAYDPWGNRRNPTNWSQADARTSWLVNRGFTGHEHIDSFGIINMNGRVYDPLTGQFHSPDAYVQSPDNWLNYNRYSYAFGNPLKYTDPSGNSSEPGDIPGLTSTYGGSWSPYSSSGGYSPYSNGSYDMVNYANHLNWLAMEQARIASEKSMQYSNTTNYGSNDIAWSYNRARDGEVEFFYSYDHSAETVDHGYGYVLGLTNGSVVFGFSDNGAHSIVFPDYYSSGGDERDWLDKTNTIIGASSLVFGMKETIIEGGAALNRGINISKVNNISLLRTYGATGAKYLKLSKSLGVAGSIVTTGYSISKVIDQKNQGGWNNVFSHRDLLDVGVGTVGLGATALTTVGILSNPIGWGIGISVLVYGGTTLIYDAATEP